MTYQTFLKNPDLLERLLNALGILETLDLIIKIDHMPNYDLSEYKRESISNYVFQNSFDFSKEYKSVIKYQLSESSIFDFNTLGELAKKHKMDFHEGGEEYFLTKLIRKDKNILTEGWGLKNEEFELTHLQITSIDNYERKLLYQGSFKGNNSDIQPDDWNIFSHVIITAIPDTIDNIPFYKSLLSESYTFHYEKKYKLAYFLAFSAFESFVNYTLNTDDPERLKQKIKDLFKTKSEKLKDHQIYSSVINDFKGRTDNRNTIAHGKGKININNESSKDMLMLSTVLIASFETDSTTFTDLMNKI